MTNYVLDGKAPEYVNELSTYVAPGAMVIGEVAVGDNVSLWPYVVIRGDNEPITIGANTNIQEHSLLHTDPGFSINIGEGCTIGHRAILHGCKIGNNSLVGMGAIVLNGAKIGNNCLVGAGALVTEGKEFPDGSLIVGSPAKVVRALSEAEIARLSVSAAHYVANGRRFKAGLSEV